MLFRKITAAVMAAILAFMMLACPAYAEGGVSEAGAAVPEKYLEGKELELYRLLLECMIWVSDGRRDAQTFYLNVSKGFANNKEYEKAIEKVMYFMYSYAPEYSYWADSRGFRVYDNQRCGIIYGISPAYASFGNKYTIDPKKLDNAQKAFENAKAIADRYRGVNDFKKVLGYAKEICALTEYDRQAEKADSESHYSQKNIDPWTIVNVFDNDSSTNVVCAGYAKAFQYLCSLGGIECHYVTGYVPEGYHAWNIVVINGKNYFVDLTVCDQYPEDIIEKYHPFVLNSVVSSTAEGFSTYYSRSGLTFGHSYTYAEDEQQYLPEELRVLEKKEYSPGKTAAAVAFVIVAAAGVTAFIIFKRKMASIDVEY